MKKLVCQFLKIRPPSEKPPRGAPGSGGMVHGAQHPATNLRSAPSRDLASSSRCGECKTRLDSLGPDIPPPRKVGQPPPFTLQKLFPSATEAKTSEKKTGGGGGKTLFPKPSARRCRYLHLGGLGAERGESSKQPVSDVSGAGRRGNECSALDGHAAVKHGHCQR